MADVFLVSPSTKVVGKIEDDILGAVVLLRITSESVRFRRKTVSSPTVNGDSQMWGSVGGIRDPNGRKKTKPKNNVFSRFPTTVPVVAQSRQLCRIKNAGSNGTHASLCSLLNSKSAVSQ